MKSNNFVTYQNGFQKGYSLAKKLIGTKNYAEVQAVVKVSKHIETLNKTSVVFEDINNLAIESKKQIDDFMYQFSSPERILNSIIMNDSIVQLDDAFKLISFKASPYLAAFDEGLVANIFSKTARDSLNFPAL